MLTVEHLIPKCLGGKLTSPLLCRECNSFLGHAVEAEVRSDPSIRLAVQNLQSKIPELAKKITENQGYLTCGPGGRVSGKMRKGEIRVTSREAPDGSLILPIPEARKAIKTMLTKSGAEAVFVDAALEKFDGAKANERVQLSHDLEVTKWTIDAVELDLLGNPLMKTLAPLKVAFEFLAYHVGPAIYDDASQLRDLRDVLLGATDDNSAFRVERLSAARYEPFHGVCFEGNNPHARFQVRLFGWLAFRVHFLRLVAKCDQYAYTHNLATGREYLSKINSTAGP